MKTSIKYLIFSILITSQAIGANLLDRRGFVPTFSAEFNEAAGFPVNPDIWKTNYYFGTQLTKTWPNGSPVTMAQQASSRMITGERQVYVDKDYCGRSATWVGNGSLYLTASKADPLAKKTCGQGTRDFLSGLITTQKSFSQTYGYFEMRAILPLSSGTWPAFWLLPTKKTDQNLGRLPEMDIVEHWAGDVTVMSKGKPFVIKRKGKVVSTLHLGSKGQEYVASNSKNPPVIDVSKFHTYGMLWTPTEAIFYLDGVETFRTPFVNNDPHYILLNMAVSETAGDPALGTYPAYFIVDWVRAYKIN